MAAEEDATLRQFTGAAPWSVLFCPTCLPATLPTTSNVATHNEYAWALTLTCPLCSKIWNVCKICTKSKKPFTDNVQMYHHDYNKHRNKKKRKDRQDNQEERSGLDAGLDCDFDVPSLDDTSGNSAPMLLDKAIPGPPTFNFNGNHNENYFRNQAEGNLGGAYLVGRSHFKLNNVANDIDRNEVGMHMNITTLLSQITRGQRDLLAVIFKQVSHMTLRHNFPEGRPVWATKIPFTSNDMRKLYINGKHAVLPNLPRPPIHVIDDHAFVSIKDCIADILGHGLELDYIEEKNPITTPIVARISQSAVAQRIYQNALRVHNSNLSNVICLYLTEWSDGFEPSLSIKGNRGSCWIKSITISPPPGSIHSLTHTYPIAIGTDGVSHNKVELKFAADLAALSSGKGMEFYHGGLRRSIRVHVELFASLQDQPERRSANYIMLGSSKFTARWGLALDFAAVASGIPACSDCLRKLLRGEKGNNCLNCVNWDTEVKNGLLDFTPPPLYPEHLLPPSGKLSPLRLTYETMKAAVATAHEAFASGGWTKPTTNTYLRVHGLNNEAILSILECAQNCKLFEELKADAEVYPDEYDDIVQKKNASPELFQRWKFPALWERGVQLSQHVDVVMHLLFLGIVKTCIQMVQEWAKLRGKHSAFLKYSVGTMESVQGLGLDWCRCVTYKTGKLGGWVSENYLAACRISSWFYGSIDEVASDLVFENPSIDPKKWTKKNNHGWLAARSLNTKGNAAELRQRVKEFMTQPGGAPPVSSPQGGEVSNVHNMIVSLKAMVARTMATQFTEADIEDTERHIKLFLSAFNLFDSAVRKDNETPTWISSYNFVCLTNIPAMIRDFGPLRNLWEGGGQGEKIVSLIKPFWAGYRKNWQRNSMDSLLKRMAMIRVNQSSAGTKVDTMDVCASDDNEDSDIDEDDEDLEQVFTHRGKLFHQYRNLQAAQSDFSNRKPVSVVQLPVGTFVCILRDGTSVELVCGEFDEMIAGACYHHWSIGNASQQQQNLVVHHLFNYCLLLPKLSKAGMPSSSSNPLFTLIDSEWNEIQPNKLLGKPKVPGARYA